MAVTCGSIFWDSLVQFLTVAKISGGDKIPYEKPTCNLNLISKLQGGIEDIYILMSKTVVVVLVASSF